MLHKKHNPLSLPASLSPSLLPSFPLLPPYPSLLPSLPCLPLSLPPYFPLSLSPSLSTLPFLPLSLSYTKGFCQRCCDGSSPLPYYETALHPSDSIFIAFQEIVARPLINQYVVGLGLCPVSSSQPNSLFMVASVFLDYSFYRPGAAYVCPRGRYCVLELIIGCLTLFTPYKTA